MQLVDEMRRVSRGLVETEEAAHGALVCSASSPEKPEARPISLISHGSQHLPSGDPGHPAFAYVSRRPGLAGDRPLSNPAKSTRTRDVERGPAHDPGNVQRTVDDMGRLDIL